MGRALTMNDSLTFEDALPFYEEGSYLHADRLFELLFDKDEITWQSILFELVRTEQMDPWDIDVSLLTQKYMDMIKKLKEMDFRVSGKILLAAAILLRMKSNRLVGEDLDQLDRLFSGEEEEELDFEEFPNAVKMTPQEKSDLIPRTPQPRKRKVSVYDLVNALERALETKRRRVLQSIPPTMSIPAKRRDITEIIKEVYGRIKGFFYKNRANTLTFSKLIPSESKEDKVYTFIPLLHLTNQRKIDLFQEQHFGEIEIVLKTEGDIKKELGEEIP